MLYRFPYSTNRYYIVHHTTESSVCFDTSRTCKPISGPTDCYAARAVEDMRDPLKGQDLLNSAVCLAVRNNLER